MSEKEKTYSLKELSNLVGFNKSFVKVVAKQLYIDYQEPIREEDAAQIAEKLHRPWPPTD